MKTNYTIQTLFLLLITAFFAQQVHAQFKIVAVDPAADKVTIKNFGTSTQNVGAYRLCSLISYRTLSTLTIDSGTLNLAPNGEVTVIAPSYLNDTAADLGLYLPTGNFGSAANMIDFTQWGSGGNGRESVAVAKGIWTAGTFINVAPPYAFTGGATDFGVGFWDTLLNVEDFNNLSGFKLYPNPTSSILNIALERGEADVTLQVFDILGKQILEETSFSGSLSQIDVSEWNSGLYLIKISNDSQTSIRRFVRN